MLQIIFFHFHKGALIERTTTVQGAGYISDHHWCSRHKQQQRLRGSDNAFGVMP
jgi:hypothetical protein